MKGAAEAPKGFTVGTVLERGKCECCGSNLQVGDRAALWSPTGEMFCIHCANECKPDAHDPKALVALAALITLAFMAYVFQGC